ncbi:MAG: hypothetical protein R6U63_01335 [Longimicrobiales bacterium]
MATGEELDQRLLEIDAGGLERDSVIMNGGIVTPDGGYLVRLKAPGWDGLAWFDADGALVGRSALPDYGPVYPSTRDIEESMQDARRLERLAGRAGLGDWVARYRERPLGFFPRGSPTDLLQFDDRGRLWARSTRPGEGGSYLELFEGRAHVATIEVPGRVKAFRITDTLLVALVEAMDPDSAGVYPRRFDWYRIVETPVRPEVR